MANPSAWHGKRLQLHGHVVDKSIEKRPGTLDYRFKVQSNGEIVTATGTLALDRDFGAGYRYGVIVEGATLSK